MVEIAEEFVEAVHCGQKLVAVAEMVLTDLRGGVAMRLEQLGDGRVLVLQPLLRAGQTYFEEADPERMLAGDERRPPRCARLLRIVIRE
jgi:hypothetical protein